MFDKNSKFGTLVQLQGPLQIKNEKVGIQCGKTLITFSVREEKIREEEEAMMTETVSRVMRELSMERAQHSKKSQNHKKKPHCLKNGVKNQEVRDGGSEGTLDVEEIAPPVNKELNGRSKKISKRSKKSSKK